MQFGSPQNISGQSIDVDGDWTEQTNKQTKTQNGSIQLVHHDLQKSQVSKLTWKDIILTRHRSALSFSWKDSMLPATLCFDAVFLHFKTSSHVLQLFTIMLPHCFALKLWKCFGDSETSPAFSSAWGWVAYDCILNFGWTYPLITSNCLE